LTMLTFQSRLGALAALLALGLLATGVAATARALSGRRDEPPPAGRDAKAERQPKPEAEAVPEPAKGVVGLTVRGTVVDGSGRPVPGATVKMLGAMWSPPDTTTDADGAFAFTLRPDMPPRVSDFPKFLALADAGRLQGSSPEDDPSGLARGPARIVVR